jgi:ribosomal protein L16 Arg81 hydroxylase
MVANKLSVEFILEAGEMLYVPRKWPHAATALEPSLSLSANFLATVNKVTTPFLRHPS